MSNLRIGYGYDVHRLVDGRRLVLGGVHIPFAWGLEGHSDADVLIHAIMDALLGAAGLPDIGQQFPPSDESYRGADSVDLLKRVNEKVTQSGFSTIVNIDSVVMAERPAINPHVQAMKKIIAAALAVAPSAINVKATSTEGLGLVGREEGIAASAVCLISSDG